jgi:pyruvate dehydrogenase E2 component (dihydrolipoamide acetyltransferase)
MSTFRLPDLGEGLAEAEIVEWHVKVGDHVRVDQPMVSVETAKAVVEVPAPFSGVVTALRGGPGDIVLTGAALIEFDSGTVVGSMPGKSEEEYEELSLAGGAHRQKSQRAVAVPAARALAKRLGVDLAAVQGSGRAGLITLDDVLQNANMSIASGGAPASPAARAIAAAAPGDGTVEPLRGVRRAMAQSMSLSRDQVSGSTVCDDADIHCWTKRGDYMLRLMRAMVFCLARRTRVERLVRSGCAIAHWSRTSISPSRGHPGGLIVRWCETSRRNRPTNRAGHRNVKGTAQHPARRTCRDFTLMPSISAPWPAATESLRCLRSRDTRRRQVRDDAVVVAGAVQAHRRIPVAELRSSLHHGGEACRFLAAVIADLSRTKEGISHVPGFLATTSQGRRRRGRARQASQIDACGIGRACRPMQTSMQLTWPRVNPRARRHRLVALEFPRAAPRRPRAGVHPNLRGSARRRTPSSRW